LIDNIQSPETVVNRPISLPSAIDDRNSDSLEEFNKCIQNAEDLIKEKSWDLETKHCKYYCGFKS
jgi:hypothetical protein